VRRRTCSAAPALPSGLLKGATRRIESPLRHDVRDDHRATGPAVRSLMSLGRRAAPDGGRRGDRAVISLALRSGVPCRDLPAAARDLLRPRGGLGPNKVMSVPDAIGIAIEKWMQRSRASSRICSRRPDSAPASTEVVRVGRRCSPARGARTEQDFIGACPDCGRNGVYRGCAKCHVCGFSEVWVTLTATGRCDSSHDGPLAMRVV